jgi:hypothetical protein
MWARLHAEEAMAGKKKSNARAKAKVQAAYTDDEEDLMTTRQQGTQDRRT